VSDDEGRTATAEAPGATAPADPLETPAAETAAADACPRCGAALRPDQEWCLNCGAAARTRVAAPAGWRAPLAIVGAVLAVALVGLVVAFLAVSDDSDELTRIAQQPTAQPNPAPSPAPPAPTPAPPPAASPSPVPTVTPAPGEEGGADPNGPLPSASGAGDPSGGSTAGGAIASWPEGEDAFTVVLLSSPSRSGARKRAQELASGGTEVGLLDSDDFSSLRGGYWVVFSGRYESREEGEQAAESLQDAAPGAYVRKVTPR